MKKKLFAIFIALMSVISLCSFTIDGSFKNEHAGQTLYLYENGKIVVVLNTGERGSGKYDLKNGKIYIEWDNGISQQGTFLKRQDGSIWRITVEGVSYDQGRRVVPRR